MGISPFKGCSVYPENSSTIAPNPNPINFQILKLYEVENTVIAKIRYPDCTNFEGIKICVFENTTAQEIRKRSVIDPHFSQDHFSPIARFKPTERGIKLAFKLADELAIETNL